MGRLYKQEGSANSPSMLNSFRLSKQQLALYTEDGAISRDLVSGQLQDSYAKIKAIEQETICWCTQEKVGPFQCLSDIVGRMVCPEDLQSVGHSLLSQ